MNPLRMLWLLLALLAANATAGQGVQNYYLTSSSDSSALPRYRSVGEGCVAVLRNDMRAEQKAHPTFQWRYRLAGVGQDDGFSEFSCTGTVDELISGLWQPKDNYGQQNAYVFGFSHSVSCVLSGLKDTETGQCGPPKCCLLAGVGDPIDAGTGDKQQVETDYIGAGAFPLHFERTYDSSRTWLNNPVPIGVAWTHAYLASIYFMPAEGATTITQAIAYRPNGSILRFNLVGGVWAADADVPERLTATIDGNNIPTATLTNTDDSVEHYDGNGRLISITDRDGLTQMLSYVTSTGTFANDVQSVTDPQGHVLAFGYNASGQLASVTDGNGTMIQYGYDASGNLANVVYPDVGGGTRTRTYSYNEAGQVAASWPNALTGITDENSQRYASWGYDSQGRAVLSVHGPYATGTIDKTTLTFNSNGTTSFMDALGQSRIYGFNVKYAVAHPASLDVPCDTCSAHDAARGYDSNGYPNASTDFNGNQATYAFTALDGNNHSRGLETQRLEGKPPSADPTNTAAERTINTQWHADFRVPLQQDVLDVSNATVQTTKWVYNTRGQPTFRCLIDPAVSAATGYACGSAANASTPAGVRQWAYIYCDAVGTGCPLVGLLLTSADPRGDLTTDGYYQVSDTSDCATGGTCHYVGDVQTVTDALGHITTYANYDGDGRPTRIVDANGVPTDLSYHTRGWLTQSAVRNLSTGTSASDRITSYIYDGVGQVTQITQPAGDYLIFGYDNAHRLTDITNRMNEHLHYVLDNAGNRTEEDSYTASGVLNHKTLRDYDVLGRLHDLKNAYAIPATLAMTYTHDGNGNVQQSTDGGNHVTSSTYDPRNRMVETEQDAATGGLKVFTDYLYDPLDHLIDVKDPQGLHTHYTFDGLGNLTQLTSPDTGITTYNNDAAGNRTGQVDARTAAANYGYDALNRLTSIVYPATPTLNVTYTWDDATSSGCASPNLLATGHLSKVVDASGTTKFCYNRFADMALKTQTIAGAAFPVAYVYNKDGRLNSLTEPNGTVVSYVRDNNLRIKTVNYQLSGQSSTTTLVSAVAYNPFGPANKITYGIGTTARTLIRTYDLDGVVKTIADRSMVGDGLNLTYGRDAVANLIQIKTSVTTGNKFVYDDLNRLTRVSDLGNVPQWRYTYDYTGNRLSKQQGTQAKVNYAYPLDSHHLLDVGITARQYDAAGNTSQIGTGASRLNFHFDDSDRMDQVKVGGALAKKYLTNALGQRVSKSKTGDTSQTVKTVYDEQGHRLGDFNATNATIAQYIWMDDLPVGVVDGATHAVNYIEPDHLGTPRVVIEPAANHVIWSWSILNDPFGETQPINLNASTFTLNLRLPGQVHDAESGTDYNYSRDYDSSVGRYIESDPVGLRGGIDNYFYANGNPIQNIDAFGLLTWKCIAASTGGSGYSGGHKICAYQPDRTGLAMPQDSR